LHEPVKLGQGGINQGIIQPDAYQRGIETMRSFHQHICKFPVKRIKAMATSALRSTSNGPDFINQVKAETNIQIEVIDGDAEAGYIYQGIKASGCLRNERDLIIDIGGGSVEFIICNERQIFWKQSFEIGAARLMDLFQKSDPIAAPNIAELNQYLEHKLQPLFEAVQQLPVERLIGSSGAFETFLEVIELGKGHPFDLKAVKHHTLDLNDLTRITDTIISSTHQQRAGMQGIIPLRVDMIVVASLLTRFVVRQLNLKQVAMSTYSLKEGVLAELLG
jgi:exopolyphosphatase / guanosine-5'-triphosphate,3'-diphosphate pyrophosphatase